MAAHIHSGCMANWRSGSCLADDLVVWTGSIEAFAKQIINQELHVKDRFLFQYSLEVLSSHHATLASPPTGTRTCCAAGQQMGQLAGSCS